MSIVDRIVQDLSDEQVSRVSADRDQWYYGARNPAELRAVLVEEARLYPDEVADTCTGCNKRTHISLLTLCEECGEQVCADCPPTCPHKED